MKRWCWIVLLAVLLPSSFVSAQKNPVKDRLKQRAENPRLDLSKEPECAPTEDLNVQELQLQRNELKGQVIELEFDNVIDLQQAGPGYTARVTFESPRVSEGVTIMFPAEGLEFIQPLADHRGPLRATVYVEVINSKMLRALGTRYSKNKPEGERYSW